MSSIKKLLYNMAEARELIKVLTGITEEELNELVYNRAMDCLKYVLRTDEYGITEMPKRPEFWSWWKVQWHRQDLLFLERIKMPQTLDAFVANIPEIGKHVVLEDMKARRGAYLIFHKTRNNIYINSAMIEQSYHGLMKTIANNQTI